MIKRGLYLTLVILVMLAILLRLMPSYLTKSPFSTDVWPLIRISKKLMSNPNAKIWVDKLFDGYNNHWPGTVLSCALISLITSINIIATYSILMPSVIVVAMYFLFSSLLKRLGYERIPRALSASYLLLVPSLLVFTAPCLKEVYAYPLALTVLLAPFLGDRRWLAVLILASVSLSITHHLASLATIAMLGGASFLLTCRKVLGRRNYITSVKQLAVSTLVMMTIFAFYYAVYGSGGSSPKISLEDALIYLAYAVPTYAFACMSTCCARARSSTWLIASIIAMSMPTIQTFVSIVPGISIQGSRPEVYSLPIALTMLLYAILRPFRSSNVYLVPLALFIAATSMYIVFTNPLIPLHRILNYMSFLCAFMLADIGSYENTGKVIATILTTLTLVSSITCTTMIVSCEDPLGSGWLYKRSDVFLINFLSKVYNGKEALAGDNRISFALSMVMKVSVTKALKLLVMGTTCSNTIYVYDWYDLTYGFMSSQGPLLPSTQFISKLNELSRLLDLGNAWIFKA